MNTKPGSTKNSSRGRLTRALLWVRTAARPLKDPIDAFNKMTIAFVAIAAPFVANSFERSLSRTALLSQREQAESQLRATMFSNLIGPIIGPRESGEIDTERERLLAELLALNFHEHFEFKPLMMHVDDRLRTEPRTPEWKRIARNSLRSIARRVVDRQLAGLVSEGGKPAAEVWSLTFQDTTPPQRDSEALYGRFDDGRGIHMKSPDGAYKLVVNAASPDWDEDTIRVRVAVFAREKTDTHPTHPFTLTPFDFPLTDNTLLPDGNRFALVVTNNPEELSGRKKFKLKLVWFPRGYFTPRERPLTFAKLIGG